RFDNLFIYQFNIEKDIDEENTLLPPMIIQPFIENAIKHGLSPRSSGGELLISIYKRTARPHSYLYVEIKDNGVGRKEANNNKTNSEGGHISKGIDITINRIKSTCSANGLPDTDCFEIMDVNDNSISTGTLIKIKLPLIENF
ncbi:MAG: hypothetical protein ABIP51_08820, partial [Bacteroidia bacterium]